jgi:ribosome-associated translation inhibitor RaiA
VTVHRDKLYVQVTVHRDKLYVQVTVHRDKLYVQVTVHRDKLYFQVTVHRDKLYVQVTVHRDKLRIKQQTRCIKYPKFYFIIKLYMFRASSVPIIRSYLLYTRQLVRFMQVM